MKLIVIIMISTLMQVSAASFAQKLSYAKKGASLEEVFKQITLQTGYNVLYAPEKINELRKIDVNFKNADLKDVLDVLTKNDSIVYTIDEKNIIIKSKEPSLLDKLASVIQNGVKDLVKGRVVDQDGKPLPNASIRIKGKNTVINTNQNGEFEIKDVAEDAVLVISYVGYKQLELPIKGVVMPLEIKLNQITGELEEVKVTYNTGYQPLPKERATGSFVQIDKELFNRKVSTNVLERIVEVTNGLTYNYNTGQSFGNRSGRSPLNIRGISTINAGQTPLIVLDNFPYDGDLALLNPNDIESITVLKDAAAASIWGVRSGNGVIVITTKKGNYNRKTEVHLNANTTIGEKPNFSYIPLISSADRVDLEVTLFNQGYYDKSTFLGDTYNMPALSPVVELLDRGRKGLINASEVNLQLNNFRNINIKDDISKYFYQKSISQQYSANINGGDDKFKFYNIIGYDKNRGSVISNEYSRLNIQAKTSYRPVKNLEFSGDISYTQTSSTDGFAPPSPNGEFSPYTKLVDENGNGLNVPYKYRSLYVDTISKPGLLNWKYNPLQEQANYNRLNAQNDIRLSTGVKFGIIPDLNIDLKYQYQKTLSKSTDNQNIETFNTRDLINKYMFIQNGLPVYPVPLGGILLSNEGDLRSYNLRGQLNYSKTFTNNHSLSAIVGFDLRETKTSNTRRTQYGFDNDTGLFQTNMNFDAYYNTTPSGYSRIDNSQMNISFLDRYLSYFANTGYTLFDRYTITGSGRIDMANFFGVNVNDRLKPLWSIGGSWNLNKENFMVDSPFDILRLRSTYGIQGNTNNSATAYSTMMYNNSSFNYPTIFGSIVSPPNPELRWEKVAMLNFGVDFELKNKVIAGSIEYYQKKMSDLIAPKLVESTTGLKTITGNTGSIDAKGLDINLNIRNLNRKLKWFTTINFSYVTNRIKQIDQISQPTVNDYVSSSAINEIGKPLYGIYRYKWADLNPTNGDPMVYVGGSAKNYDVALSPTLGAKISDLVWFNSVPKSFGNIINEFRYNNLSASFNISFKFNYYFVRPSISYDNLLAGWNGHSDYSKRWIKAGDELITNVPSIPSNLSLNSARTRAYIQSSELIEPGDHIRFQDFRFNYDFQNKGFLSGTRLYVYVNNIGILWKKSHSDRDPDFFNDGSMPPPRTISLGLHKTF